MLEIKPLQQIPETTDPKIFLAGSIEMDTAEHWQAMVVQKLTDEMVVLLNPRRDGWDATWEQRKDNPAFRAQVEWELDALAKSDHIVMYFDPNTKSPISLLEMGLYAQSGKLMVVCPDGFWRKGNVDIVCERYGIPQYSDLATAIDHIVSLVRA
ncbi:MAG: nucleoside 2-deoxyribosyltransferase domain-containing protein [bacterium]|nr:nucleoside 2-deoxyribosyltransferase domain-containing protein [bacterium]